MAYKKRQVSSVVVKANKRRDGLQSIDKNVDLGSGLTDLAYKAAIDGVIGLTEQYNTMLSQLDGHLTLLKQEEKKLAEMSKRVLSGVGTKYGFDSIEYEKAGGVRKSDHKRRSKKGSNGSEAK